MSSISIGMPHIDSERLERLERYSKYVAVLPWFNIDVLHKLYLNIYQKHQPGSEGYEKRAITCADFIHSPFVKPIHYNAFVIETLLQDQLRLEIKDQKEIMAEIGNFMLAYAMECREHFLGPKFLESFRLEGNLILNPAAEAQRITSHIVNRLNNIAKFQNKKDSVAYYLNILESHNTSPEQEELMKFLEGYQNYDHESQDLPQQWTSLKSPDNNSESITIKLPGRIKESILNEIQKKKDTTGQKTLHALIIGIDEYQNEPMLRSAVSDAKLFGDYLKSNQRPDRTYEPRILLNNQAERENIIENIKAIVEVMKEGDVFVLYFAGYGGIEPQDLWDKGAASSERPEGVRPLVICFDTLTSEESYGLDLAEIEYFLSHFPKSCESVLVLDCGFWPKSEIELKEGTSTRSLFSPRPSRPIKTRISDTHPYERETTLGYNGIVLYASKLKGAVRENESNGYFTLGLYEMLQKYRNEISYADLISNNLGSQFSAQQPYFETKGNFSAEQFYLDGFLSTGSDDVRNRIQAALEKGSTELDISGFELSHFPEEVLRLDWVTTLDISHNQITSIPSEVAQLRSLEVLAAHNNPIEFVDDAIADLGNLRVILMYKCKLKTFPKGLLRLRGLKNLQLESNQIKWIPIDLKDLPVLGQIDIRNNPILNLPEDLRQSSVTELMDFYYQWEPDLYSNQKKPFVLVIGIDYDNTLSNLKAELERVEQILHSADLDCKVLYNPNTIDIFGAIYQQQQVMSILHIAAFKLDELLGPDKVRHSISSEDLAEMFKCIRPTKFKDQLLVLNYCENADLINDHLLGDLFDMAIGMEEKVSDELAFAFSQEFYSQLAEGHTLSDAFGNTQQKLTTYE